MIDFSKKSVYGKEIHKIFPSAFPEYGLQTFDYLIFSVHDLILENKHKQQLTKMCNKHNICCVVFLWHVLRNSDESDRQRICICTSDQIPQIKSRYLEFRGAIRYTLSFEYNVDLKGVSGTVQDVLTQL